MSYSTSSPGSETAPVPKRRVAALFTACLLLLTTAGVGVASTAGAADPAPYANPGVVNATPAPATDPPSWGSIKVTWTTPVPSDFVAGYLVLIQDAATPLSGTGGFVLTDGTRVVHVNDPATLSTVVKYLDYGITYRVTVISTNGEVSNTFINNALSGLAIDMDTSTASEPPTTPPDRIPFPGKRYEFPTVDAMINAHYQEFLDRAPTFVERTLWQEAFQNNGPNLGCVGVDLDPAVNANTPPALWNQAPNWGPNPVVTDQVGADNCPNTGTEYRMISILRTGSPGWVGINQPWSANFWAENPTTFQGIANPITRLYLAYFDRAPDTAGFNYWTGRFHDGTGSLDWISDFFAQSVEFSETYPSIVTNADFVSLVYFNVLNRAPDNAGMAFWAAQLSGANGTGPAVSKGRVMNQFAQSDENIQGTQVQTAIVNIYAGLLGRTPTQGELAQNTFWAKIANNTQPDGSGVAREALNVWVIQGAVRNSAEYKALQG